MLASTLLPTHSGWVTPQIELSNERSLEEAFSPPPPLVVVLIVELVLIALWVHL